jgi:hypothetical protein
MDLIVFKLPECMKGKPCGCGCGQVCDSDEDVLVQEYVPGGKYAVLKKSCFDSMKEEDERAI